MSENRRWVVRYTDSQAKRAHRPFWQLEDIIEATSRQEALVRLQAQFPPPRYTDWHARSMRKGEERGS